MKQNHETVLNLQSQLSQQAATISTLECRNGHQKNALVCLISALGVLVAYILSGLIVSPVATTGISTDSFINSWPVLDFNRLDLYNTSEKARESIRLFNKAAQFSGESGEGRQGWLHLLAAYSYDKLNMNILSNLVSNYEALNYGAIGYSTLLESNVSKRERDAIMPYKRQMALRKELNKATSTFHNNNTTIDPGRGNTTLMFATALSRWDVSRMLPAAMNAAIYSQSVSEYEKLKTARPDLSATDLNHAFFRVQMAALDTSSSYWGPFKDVDGFPELVGTMRKCVSTFLKEYHGWDEASAVRKASHPMVVWVSVHTADSVHQPHVTEDALVGGVYYVSVPYGSGKLHIYDPRGKHPLHGLHEPTSPPDPPFHRMVSLKPAESLLVLFPGWLVHSVGSASVSSFDEQQQQTTTEATSDAYNNNTGGETRYYTKYRVSLSLNLKGEWGDTAGAAFGVPTYEESDSDSD